MGRVFHSECRTVLVTLPFTSGGYGRTGALVAVGRHLAAVQLIPDGAHRPEPLCPQGFDQGLYTDREFGGGPRAPLVFYVPAVLPQLDAAPLGRLQGVAGANADLLVPGKAAIRYTMS